MFDLGWTELMVIGIVALIVVGPKDLPGMFQAVGKFVGKAKQMAREFSRAMNDAAEDSGMSDVTSTLQKAANPVSTAMNEVKKSTESFTAKTMSGPEPKRAEFDDDRKELVKKISERSTEMANERKAAEEAAKLADAKPASKKPAAKKPAAKKAPAKAAKTKPAVAKKTPAKKPAAKKPATKKTAAKPKSGDSA